MLALQQRTGASGHHTLVALIIHAGVRSRPGEVVQPGLAVDCDEHRQGLMASDGLSETNACARIATC